MFRIEAFCDDKNLSHVLHALTGLIRGQLTVQPVANAQVMKGQIRSRVTGGIVEQFAEYSKKNKIEKFTASEIKNFAKLTGLAPTSYGYIIKQLYQAGAIKKHGKGSQTSYTVKA